MFGCVLFAVSISCEALQAAEGARVGLTEAARRELAEADRLDGEIQRLTDAYRLVDLMVACTRQLEIRSRILGPDHRETAASWHEVGRAYFFAGLYERAEEFLRIALAKRRAGLPIGDPAIAATLVCLGRLAKDSGFYTISEAEQLQLEALSILETARSADALEAAPVHEALGHVYRRLLRHEEAEASLRRAIDIRIRHRGEDDLDVADNLTWFAYYLMLRDRFDEAEELLVRSSDILERLGRHDSLQMAETLGWLGRIRMRRGDLLEAERLVTQAWSWHALQRDDPIGFAYRGNPDLCRSWLLILNGKSNEAWASLERENQAVAILEELACRRRSDPGRAGRLDAVAARVLDLERQLGRAPASSPAREELLLQLAFAEAVRMRLESDLAPRIPIDAAEEALARVQAVVAPDAAIVGWMSVWPYINTPSVFAYVIRNAGPVRWTHLGTWASVEELNAWRSPLDQYRSAIQVASTWPRRVQPDAELEKLAASVYERLFAPMEEDLRDVGRLMIVSDRFARSVPVETLRDANGSEVLQRFEISYVPSASSVTTSKPGRPPLVSRPALVVGEPVHNEAQLDVVEASAAGAGTGSDLLSEAPHPAVLDVALVRSALSGHRAALRRLPALPYSAAEVHKIASLFDRTTILTRENAREENLEALRESGALQQYGVVHLATHALVDAEVPDRSAIILTQVDPASQTEDPSRFDAMLTAREIYLGWRLDADLVVLSGCQTASDPRGHPGFVMALLRAGARSIVASRWKVDDVATALLLGRFYENLTGKHGASCHPARIEPLSKPAALREAQLWLRDYTDAEGTRPFAHPAYWSGFVLLGGAD